MSIHLPLDKMTLAEKIEAMELLWADISKQPSQLPSPEWHREVLQERKELVEQGKLQFADWDQVFDRLQGSIREDSDT